MDFIKNKMKEEKQKQKICDILQILKHKAKKQMSS